MRPAVAFAALRRPAQSWQRRGVRHRMSCTTRSRRCPPPAFETDDAAARRDGVPAHRGGLLEPRADWSAIAARSLAEVVRTHLFDAGIDFMDAPAGTDDDEYDGMWQSINLVLDAVELAPLVADLHPALFAQALADHLWRPITLSHQEHDLGAHRLRNAARTSACFRASLAQYPRLLFARFRASSRQPVDGWTSRMAAMTACFALVDTSTSIWHRFSWVS